MFGLQRVTCDIRGWSDYRFFVERAYLKRNIRHYYRHVKCLCKVLYNRVHTFTSLLYFFSEHLLIFIYKVQLSTLFYQLKCHWKRAKLIIIYNWTWSFFSIISLEDLDKRYHVPYIQANWLKYESIFTLLIFQIDDRSNISGYFIVRITVVMQFDATINRIILIIIVCNFNIIIPLILCSENKGLYPVTTIISCI